MALEWYCRYISWYASFTNFWFASIPTLTLVFMKIFDHQDPHEDKDVAATVGEARACHPHGRSNEFLESHWCEMSLKTGIRVVCMP